MPEFVKTTLAGNRAIVTLNRADLHNAFNEVVIAEVTQAFNDLAAQAEVRAIVLAGTGKSFCAGADITWMKRMVNYSFEENVRDATAMAMMLRTIRECPKPTIARVHGAAFGGGVGLTAACDLAAAVNSAVFCLSEVKLGILPAVISPYVLEKIGPGHMRRYGVTAERFDAVEARRIGLVSEVFEAVDAMDGWIGKMCEALAANGPEAIAACKKVLRDVQAAPDWDMKQTLTVQRISERRVSSEGQEGLKAFLEKRKPEWEQ